MTVFRPDELIEWQHPFRHCSRWEFAPLSATPLSPTLTRVAETFDYRDTGAVEYCQRMGFAKSNAAGIEATLTGLRNRYPTT